MYKVYDLHNLLIARSQQHHVPIGVEYQRVHSS